LIFNPDAPTFHEAMEPSSEITLINLKRGRAKPFWHGNPLVYSGAIHSVDGHPQAGSIVIVNDDQGQPVGWGIFNPHSQYRVRLLAFAGEAIFHDRALLPLLTERLQAARNLRRTFGLPSSETNAYRLLNSEGDRTTGLTVDMYGLVAVVASSALWTELYRREVEAAIAKVLASQRIIWHPMTGPLQRDSWQPSARGVIGKTHLGVQIQELGITYKVMLGRGQKTGFYCDQRDNRKLIRELSRGRQVLDIFCYTGGFALNAAKGGAQKVAGVDTSKAAIELAQENARLNDLQDIQFQRGDALSVLHQERQVDLIILDPPKLAPSRRELAHALRHYQRLNREALRLLKPGGLLFTCSCSAALKLEAFRDILREAAHQAERTITILKVTSAGPDHPVHPAFPEGHYLTCLLIAVV